MKQLLRFVLILLLFAACKTDKYLPGGEKYLNSGRVELRSPEKVHDKSLLNDELNELLYPAPNKKLLGMRYGVYFHYKIENGDSSKINKWLNKKYGEKPVWVSQLDSVKTMQLITNRLENRGFFNPKVSSHLSQHSHSGNYVFRIELPRPYIIDTLFFPTDSSQIAKEITQTHKRTLLIPGHRFDLDIMKAERERIQARLKNKGYYYFDPDNLVFRIDTNMHSTHRFNLYLSIKENIPTDAAKPFVIEEVIVYPNYSVKDSSLKLQDSTVLEGFRFIQHGIFFKPDRLKNYILFKPGDLYNKHLENLTSSRIGSLGTYKYVSVRFKKTESSDSTSPGKLAASIYLSPLNKHAVRAEMQAVWKSNNFIGPALLLTYSNINLFKGGEILKLTGKASYEVQLAGGRQTGLSSYETGLTADLILPRIFGFSRKNRYFSASIPKTFFRSSFSFLDRIQYYRLKSFLFTYGITTNTSKSVSHELNFPSINFVGISRTAPRFDTILLNNPFLRKSYEKQFIAGLIYKFQYNQLPQQQRKNRFLVLFGLDMAGNLIHLLHDNQTQTFLGEPYARYVRADLDVRHYLKTSKRTQLVSRIFGGVGVPFGNSPSLPYIKQYFSGGPNSLRAFRIRSLGPGVYKPENLDVASYFDQSGDSKVESNVEFRFPMVSVIKGAVFIDAGNTWLYNDNPALPGGKFSKDWLPQLAVGAGYGFRLDLDFIVVRLDLATPLRKPYLPENNRWVTEFNLGYKSWRKENLIWNIAIGYPF